MIKGDRVRRLRTAKRMTQGELVDAVRKAGGRLSQGQLSAIEKGDVDRPGALVEIAGALETTEDYLLGKSDDPRLVLAFAGHGAAPDQPAVAPPTEAVPAPDVPLPPLRTEMPKDVPVLGVVVGGDARAQFDFEMNGQVSDFVRRPPRFQGRRDIFAVYVTGQSMEPWAEPGQLLYFETAKPARNLDYVLVELRPHDGEGVRPALIKRLVAMTPTKIKLRQYNPPCDLEIDRVSVLRVCRVVDLAEMMGV